MKSRPPAVGANMAPTVSKKSEAVQPEENRQVMRVDKSFTLELESLPPTSCDISSPYPAKLKLIL